VSQLFAGGISVFLCKGTSSHLALNKVRVGKIYIQPISHFIAETVRDRARLLSITNRKLHKNAEALLDDTKIIDLV